MNLYIEVENGQYKNHPAFEENLIEAFGSIPSNWEIFVRIEKPTIPEIYKIFDTPEVTYEKVNDVWIDVWHIRDMTAEEKTAKQQSVKNAWATQEQAENWSTWVFDEVTCTMTPPVPFPTITDGKEIRWCGAENNWKELPVMPIDGKQYNFNFSTWEWVEVVN